MRKLGILTATAAIAVGFGMAAAPVKADTTITSEDFAETAAFCGDGSHAVSVYETLEVVGGQGTFPVNCYVTLNEESELRFSTADLDGNVDFEIRDTGGAARVEYIDTTITTTRFGNFVSTHPSSTECTSSSISVTNRNLGLHSGADTEVRGCSLSASSSNVFVSAGRSIAEATLEIKPSPDGLESSFFTAFGFNAINSRGPRGDFDPLTSADIEITNSVFTDGDRTTIKSISGGIEVKESDFTASSSVVVETTGYCEVKDNNGTISCP